MVLDINTIHLDIKNKVVTTIKSKGLFIISRTSSGIYIGKLMSLNILGSKPKVLCPKVSTYSLTICIVKEVKLQALKLSLSRITTLVVNLDTYLNQSLSIGKVGIL